MSIAADHRFVPIALWRVASRLMVTLFNLFGEPDALARQHSMGAKDYKLACNWLRTVEALFRRLLFIEASYYVETFASSKPRAKRKHVRREMAFFPDKPDEWRVTFRMDRGRPRPHLAAEARDGGEGARAAYRSPIRFHSAWPLAERFEALLRVHNDPTPYARRLARRLNAARVADMLQAPAELEHRIDPEPFAEIEVLCAQRCAALPCVALNSS